MITAGDRLRQIAGQDGQAGDLLVLIGDGTTAGERLVDYSGLGANPAWVHLFADNAALRGNGGMLSSSLIKRIQKR